MRDSTEYIVLYAFMWGLTFILYRNRIRYFGAASLLLLLNVIYAVCGIILYNNETLDDRYQFQTLTFFPFLYLFITELIVMSPLLRFNEVKYIRIQQPNLKILNWFSIIFVVATFIKFPMILSNLVDGLIIMMINESGGEDLYVASHEDVQTRFSIIQSLSGVITNTWNDISIFFYFYLLSTGKINKFLKYGFLLSIIICLLFPISKGLRTGVIMEILTLTIAIVVFRRFLPNDVAKRIKKVSFVILAVVSLFFALLTISRFADKDGGISTYIVHYGGQASIRFNEHGLDANGVRNGDRTMNTFKRLLGFENVPEDIMDVRDKYGYMTMWDGQFSTYVGDFALDFGPIGAFLILSLFSLLVHLSIKIRKGAILFHDLLLLWFIMCVCVQGGFYLFNYSFKGNYTIIMFAVMYIILRVDYNLKKKKIYHVKKNICSVNNI